MSTPENDLNNTLMPGEKAAASTPTGKSQASASDAMVAAMLESMKAMAKDENRRKKIGMMLV